MRRGGGEVIIGDLLSRISALERTVQRYKVLVETSSAIVACTALDEALGAITQVLAERLDVAWANVYDYLEKEHALEVLAFYQIPGLNIDTEGWIGTRFDYYANSTWMQAVQERRPVIWYSDAPSLVPEELAERERWGELSSITVPLLFRDKVIGLLDVGEARHVRRYDADDVLVAQAIADHAAIAIDNARTREALQQQAITDGLTGLHNHRYLHQRLHEEVTSAHRYGHPLSLLMIDIDDFKTVNDTFGHPQGDVMLADLAGLFLEVTRRDVDIVARYGGEEFTVVLPYTPVLGAPGAGPAGDAGSGGDPAALAVAERLRQKVAGHLFESTPGQRDAHITVSVGVTELTDADTMTDFLAHADEALYEAKRRGKNATVLYRR
jgi:GGDEF domain-containing protein